MTIERRRRASDGLRDFRQRHIEIAPLRDQSDRLLDRAAADVEFLRLPGAGHRSPRNFA